MTVAPGCCRSPMHAEDFIGQIPDRLRPDGRLPGWGPVWADTPDGPRSHDGTEQAQDTYILGYLCSWMGSRWQCGCRDSAWTQSYWQIQSFQR